MKYSNDPDYKFLAARVREACSVGRVQISESPKGGYVCNVRTPTCSVRVWGTNVADVIEAARCAFQEVVYGC